MTIEELNKKCERYQWLLAVKEAYLNEIKQLQKQVAFFQARIEESESEFNQMGITFDDETHR